MFRALVAVSCIAFAGLLTAVPALAEERAAVPVFVSSVGKFLNWNEACASVMPSPSSAVTYSEPRGGFNGSFGPGCFYIVEYRDSNGKVVDRYPDWFGQNWAIGQLNCPVDVGPAWQLVGGKCVRGDQPVQRDDSCPLGNPVLGPSGTKLHFERDLAIFSDGRKIEFNRTYVSKRGLSNFAPGWRLGVFDRVLSIETSGGAVTKVTAFREGTERVEFTASGGTFSADATSGLKLASYGIDWLLTDERNNSVEVYSQAGLLTEIWIDARQKVTLTRSDASTPGSIAPGVGYLISVGAATGRRSSFTYHASGYRKTMTGPDGATWAYAVNPATLEFSVTHPDSSIRTFLAEEFNSPGAYVANQAELFTLLTGKGPYSGEPEMSFAQARAVVLEGTSATLLTGIIDELGFRIANYKYDVAGKVIEESRAGAVDTYQFQYSGVATQSPRVTIKDGLGASRTYYYSALNGTVRPTGSTQPAANGSPACYDTVLLDGNNNPSTRIDKQGVYTTYEYSSRHLETMRIEATYTGSQRRISSQWHPDWSLKTAQAEPKLITRWIFHGQPDPTNGGTVASCLPAGTPAMPGGKPIAAVCKKVEQPTSDASGSSGFGAAASGSPRIWTYTYNADGQALSETDPNGKVTAFVYYAADDTATPKKWYRGDLMTLTDPVGNTTQFTEYDANGNPTKISDANGSVTTASYHARGWLVSQSVASGGVTRTSSYEYWANGKLKKVTQPDGSWVSLAYDSSQRLTGIDDNLGNGVVFTLDDLGNRIGEAVKDPSGNLRRQVSRTFDLLNRLQSVSGAVQ